jgi:hypothetical protein
MIGSKIMRSLSKFVLLSATLFVTLGEAQAAGTKLGAEVLFDRAPDDFSEPVATKFQINAAQTFANDVVLGGSFETKFKASNGEASFNLEGTLGYGRKIYDVASLSGNIGVGERFQGESAGVDFPYYVLRVGLDVDLDKRWTWDVISYRYRNAFDTANDYNTPEVSTGISLKLDDSRSVYTKYDYDWKDGDPDSQGIKLGFTQSF